MTTSEYLGKIQQNPEALSFKELMNLIENEYEFTPTAFKNGQCDNAENENSGSCKLFAFAKLQKLQKKEALFCFGEHYKNVLEDENGTSHQNIRNFMKSGFEGLSFNGEALALKS